jgi:transposase
MIIMACPCSQPGNSTQPHESQAKLAKPEHAGALGVGLVRVSLAPLLPADLDVHLVCDNYATHSTAEIRTWLARHPRFHVHFTPTGSSWMNQVERWFGLLTDKLIRRGVHTSVQALENDIRDWIATWNDNPRPFTWTKTADEILNSLADYLAKVGTDPHIDKQD